MESGCAASAFVAGEAPASSWAGVRASRLRASDADRAIGGICVGRCHVRPPVGGIGGVFRRVGRRIGIVRGASAAPSGSTVVCSKPTSAAPSDAGSKRAAAEMPIGAADAAATTAMAAFCHKARARGRARRAVGRQSGTAVGCIHRQRGGFAESARFSLSAMPLSPLPAMKDIRPRNRRKQAAYAHRHSDQCGDRQCALGGRAGIGRARRRRVACIGGLENATAPTASAEADAADASSPASAFASRASPTGRLAGAAAPNAELRAKADAAVEAAGAYPPRPTAHASRPVRRRLRPVRNRGPHRGRRGVAARKREQRIESLMKYSMPSGPATSEDMVYSRLPGASSYSEDAASSPRR
ncbi:MAG: hypothetical protein ACLT98_13430 [Eggerthellaceae bacterium]